MAAQGSHTEGRARRAEYIRLRTEEGLSTYDAAGQLDLPETTRALYERWLAAVQPEFAGEHQAGRETGWRRQWMG